MQIKYNFFFPHKWRSSSALLTRTTPHHPTLHRTTTPQRQSRHLFYLAKSMQLNNHNTTRGNEPQTIFLPVSLAALKVGVNLLELEEIEKVKPSRRPGGARGLILDEEEKEARRRRVEIMKQKMKFKRGNRT